RERGRRGELRRHHDGAGGVGERLRSPLIFDPRPSIATPRAQTVAIVMRHGHAMTTLEIRSQIGGSSSSVTANPTTSAATALALEPRLVKTAQANTASSPEYAKSMTRSANCRSELSGVHCCQNTQNTAKPPSTTP